MNSHDQSVESADGTRLVVRRLGIGDPVVLVHGSGGGLHSWAAVAEHLARDHEVWLPARRGYGPSDVPADTKSFRTETADLIAVTEAARRSSGRPVHLVGASYGATLALHTTSADPRDVRSLAIFEPPLYAAGAEIVPLLDRYRAAFERDDAAAMAAALNEVTRVPAEIVAAMAAGAGNRVPDPVEARRSAVGWLHDLEALAQDSTDITRWSSITVPTLLLAGADTWEPMPTTMNALARTIPAVRRVTWPGQSHFVTMTAPTLVADALRQFYAASPAA
ncbi:pimeloyl-ACP methyl ester carboxylesterase [Micromonospora vinacea]|uniref:Pimeloyl-ACP methyl ester carboxylesterase n=1 Tax=Micromonospora vinacea TaxID=709878 RepID=A0ABS0K428_9ACTN|nr:alpha/beta fold hydrolase [Micromonospora vinacea]MBG6103371.1 pimeloyl-ACP methyl ester carboxylesterase [Micromonospora vinacea]